MRRRPKAGRRSRSPVAPFSAGTHRAKRTEFTRKISSPPGRRTRAASGIQRSGSAQRQAPYSEIARSNASPRQGTRSASASINGNSSPCSRWSRRAVASWAGDASRPTILTPRGASHADTYAVPHPSSMPALPARSFGRTPSSDSGTRQMPQVGSSRAQARSPPAAYPGASAFQRARLRRTCSGSAPSSGTPRSRAMRGLRHSHAGSPEVRVALGLQPRIRVAHEVGTGAAEHHLQVGGLEADVLEAVDDVGRRGDAVPAPEHGLLAMAGAVLEEDLHLAVE